MIETRDNGKRFYCTLVWKYILEFRNPEHLQGEEKIGLTSSESSQDLQEPDIYKVDPECQHRYILYQHINDWVPGFAMKPWPL